MKNRLLLYSVAGACMVLAFAGCCKCPGDCKNIGAVTVTLRPQETDNWCWLANAQMIHEYFGHSITQCSLANTRLGRNDCCNPEGETPCPKKDECNQAGNTKAAIESLNYTVTQANDPLSWNDLRKEIYCRKKPLVFSDGAAGGGVGHVRVIYGYAEAGGQRFVSLADPWEPCEGSDDVISYETYTNTAGPGRVHRRTLYQFKDNN